METNSGAERTLTERDFTRLSRLAGDDHAPELAELLRAAQVLDAREVSADIVTMYSQVELEDLHTRRRQKLTICYPADAEPSAGLISVLSPVGRSLLGLQAGAVARWQTPSGEECAAEVVAIHFQPEACGQYAL